MVVQAAAIPVTLRNVPRWVLWRYEERNGKPTKPLFSAKTGSYASSTDPNTWVSFGEALAKQQAASRHWQGVGFVFVADDDLMGMDLDHCRDPATGEIEPWAMAIVQAMNTYTEATPSGTGLHLIFRASLSIEGRKGPQAEVYQAGRYFTMTGQALERYEGEPQARQAEAERIVRELFPPKPPPPPRANGAAGSAGVGSDWEIIEHVRKNPKYDALWRGDWSEYSREGKSQSEADLALVGYIAFFAGPNEATIDSVFQQSGMFRAKWLRDDYRARTVSAALAGKTEFYQWPCPVPATGAVVPGGRAAASGADEAGAASLSQEASLPPNLTDMGNAARFAAQHTGTAHFSPAHGWLAYDGRRWKADELAAVELAKESVRAIHRAVGDEPEKGARQALSAWAFKSEENRRIQSMLTLSRSEPGIRIDGEELDRSPWLFNAGNGTIDLTTGTVRAHDAADLLTQLAPTEYDAAATCPIFDSVVLQMMNGRQELVTYLQRWLGHCLSGSTQAQELLFLHGMGANGKNTLMEVIQLALGEYAVVAPPDLLVERQHEPHSQEIVSLRGKRLVVADETQQGRRFNEAQLKRLTGSGRYTGHLMRQNDIEFTPVFKIVLMANHKPVIKGTDDAIWRRPKLVPFEVKFHEPEAGLLPVKDPTLPARLQSELPGILAWLVRGCVAWVQDDYRFRPPPVVLAASAAYRQEMDTMADFLAECCVQSTGLWVQSSLLHEHYLAWCAKNHETALKQKSFSMALLERGFQKGLGGPLDKVVVWHDLGLIASAQPDADEKDGWLRP